MGKNAIVGQSGGPTSVINASLAGVFESCKSRGADIVYGMCNGVAGLLEERVVDLSTLLTDDLDIELLKRTPSSFLGSCRYKLPDWRDDEAVYKKLFAILEKLNIGYFFYIGGNDSMDTIGKLADYGQRVGSDIRFMGVPKTIDNDLMVTDHTPGYGSAAKYIGVVMKEIIRDATVYGTKYVTVVEIMGRNAGWLTAAAALAKSDDCVIMGRCADAILKNNHIPHISLFISAPFQVRVQHVMDIRNMNLKQAVRFLKQMDKQHKKYYEFYTGEKWGKPENYDLCINSANYGIKETIDVIKRLLNQQTVQHN